MNPITLLKEDHQKVRGMLAELEATTTRGVKTRTDLLRKICQALEVHTALEEGIFYPAFREAAKGKEDKMYFEALEEHRAIEDLVLPDLHKTDPSSEKFSGRAKVLRELIEHHAHEEERDMFPRARELLDAAQMHQLGERMVQKRKELLALEHGKPLEAAKLAAGRVLDDILPRGGREHRTAHQQAHTHHEA